MFWRFFAFAQNDSVVNKSVLFVLFRGLKSENHRAAIPQLYTLHFELLIPSLCVLCVLCVLCG